MAQIAFVYSSACPAVTFNLFFRNSLAAWCGTNILSATVLKAVSSAILVFGEYLYRLSNTFASTANVHSAHNLKKSESVGRKWPGKIVRMVDEFVDAG